MNWITIVAIIGVALIVIGITAILKLQQDVFSKIKDDLKKNQERIEKLNAEAKVRCHDTEFYNGNFERCEYLGIRP